MRFEFDSERLVADLNVFGILNFIILFIMFSCLFSSCIGVSVLAFVKFYSAYFSPSSIITISRGFLSIVSLLVGSFSSFILMLILLRNRCHNLDWFKLEFKKTCSFCGSLDYADNLNLLLSEEEDHSCNLLNDVYCCKNCKRKAIRRIR